MHRDIGLQPINFLPDLFELIFALFSFALQRLGLGHGVGDEVLQLGFALPALLAEHGELAPRGLQLLQLSSRALNLGIEVPGLQQRRVLGSQEFLQLQRVRGDSRLAGLLLRLDDAQLLGQHERGLLGLGRLLPQRDNREVVPRQPVLGLRRLLASLNQGLGLAGEVSLCAELALQQRLVLRLEPLDLLRQPRDGFLEHPHLLVPGVLVPQQPLNLRRVASLDCFKLCLFGSELVHSGCGSVDLQLQVAHPGLDLLGLQLQVANRRL
mmetsp:Transcript_20188/g.47173  ORF Transcript_20188/g.47173 Transcript_20188/m.47173 type:complete len:267 (+) Transcript_20188:1141-1941(+)